MPYRSDRSAVSAPAVPEARRGQHPRPARRGALLVEFALIALVFYLLLAATITFGHLLYAAQGLQQAADLAARELSRTPLPGDVSLSEALADPQVQAQIYSEEYLVRPLLEGVHPIDEVGTWPVVNQQLFPLMIVDRNVTPPVLRYPGALLASGSTSTGYTVRIPLVTGRSDSGVETIRWLDVVEEIEDSDGSPFRITSQKRGLVALRLNYPYQAAAMSSFRPNPEGPFEPNLSASNLADDAAVEEENAPPGDATTFLGEASPESGTYGGTYGLGAQAALGQNVRPFRRLISAQAVYRREIFAPEPP